MLKNTSIDMIEVKDWKRLNYRDAWERQKELFNRLIEQQSSCEYLILVEHLPVYTLGFHGNADNLIASEEHLSAMGAECIRIERGGDITYHGPGQLVVYPVINLYHHKLGVRKYIELLESSVIELLSIYGINAEADNKEIGVWIDRNTREARKICAIGVKVSHGVTMHGLALNVNTDLSAFSLINPCGIIDKGVTSMQHELEAIIDMEEVKKRLSEIIVNRLNS